MQQPSTVQRLTNISKIWKLNILLLIAVMLAGTLAVSYAGDHSALTDGKCNARIALVLDRSSSIGVGDFNGNQDNVNAVKFGAGALAASLKGPNAFMDVYAFGSNANRINSAWLNLVDDNHVALQQAAIAQTPFKTGQHNTDSGDLYPDGMAAGSEGLTNWEAALRLPLVSHNPAAGDPLPTAIIIFTDGEPTTNIAETNAAVAAGGTYAAAGNPGVDGTDQDDLDAGYNMANYARSLGVRVIPVAIGDYSGANLQHMQTLAGPETLYKSNNFGDLTNLLKSAAADVCGPTTTPTNIHFSGVERNPADGTYKAIALPLTLDGQLTTTLSTNAAGGWTSRQFTTSGNWDERIVAQIPAGYHPISERCERDRWTGALPYLEEKEESAGINGHILLRGQAPGGDTYCEFAIEKDAAAPVDSINLDKTVNPTTAKAGDTVTYSFVVKNTGTSVLKNVKVTDPMLGGQVGATIASLAPGATAATITKTYVIPATAKAGDIIHNVATATGTPTNDDGTTRPDVSDDDPADVTVDVTPKQSWESTKTANKEVVAPGEKVTYTISVKNTGNTTLTNVEVSDPTINFAVVVIPSIAPGETKSVTADYTVPANYTGKTFKNVALVCVPKTGENKECQKPEEEIKIINIQIVKTANKSVAMPGDKVVYTFVVTNTGGADIDPTPVFDNVLGEIGNPGVLKPGESVTLTKEYTVPATAKAGDVIKNIAIVCASTGGEQMIDGCGDTDTEVKCPDVAGDKVVCDTDDHELTVQIPSITIVKTADKTNATPGETVKYTFVITNTSKMDLKDVKVVDNVLGDLGTIAELKAGASATKTVDYIVPTGATGTIRNVVTACFTTPVWKDNCASDDHVLTITAVLGTNITRPAALPFTGASSLWMTLVAGLMVAAGTTIVMLSKRRKTA